MKFMKVVKLRYVVMMLLLLSILALAACGNDVNKTKGDTEKKVHKVDDKADAEAEDETEAEKEKDADTNNPLDALNQLATMSHDSDEIYVTDDIVVGKDEEVKPGIYDLEITGGSGNIMGERSNVTSLFINWTGGTKGNDANHPSKIRMILFEDDTLEFSDISKVKFNAVPEKVKPTNKLGIGEFIVGRDISPGDYKLSTNAELDPEFENLGWDINIYNDENGQSKDQTLTATNDDVVVSLKKGEIISTSYDETDDNTSGDDVRLEFTEVE